MPRIRREVTTQVDRLKGEKGTTKYAKGAKREEIDISRRRTQTDADIFLRRPGGRKKARPPGRRDEPRYAKCGGLRLVPRRDAIASFSSAGCGVKNPCSKIRKHSAPVCASLRLSAARSAMVRFYKHRTGLAHHRDLTPLLSCNSTLRCYRQASPSPTF
jgi:hypothetical protein